jgi:hypothetical protein
MASVIYNIYVILWPFVNNIYIIITGLNYNIYIICIEEPPLALANDAACVPPVVDIATSPLKKANLVTIYFPEGITASFGRG